MAKKKTTAETAAVAATEATEAANIAETDIPNLDTQESGIEAFTDVAEVVTAEAEPDIYDLKNMPNAYGWNRETREYEGVVSPQKDPREKKWLLPGRSTWVKPPEAGEHQAVRYDNDAKAWELVADYRGETWYSKDTQTPHEIKEIDIDPAENNWTDVKPTDGAAKWDEASQSWKVPFATQKERKKASVISYYDGIMAVTKQGYSQGEIDTWQLQAQGAKDLLAGNTDTEAAKFVAALAQARQAAGDTQMTPEYLAQRIKVNAAAAAALQVPVMGKQGAEWAAADKATTEAELDSIVPYFDLGAFMAEQAEA